MRRRSESEPPIETEIDGPFEFSRDQERQIRRLIGTAHSENAHTQFLRHLASTIGLYRKVLAEEESQITGGQIRTQLRVINRSLDRLLARLQSKAFSHSAMLRIANEIYPTLFYWMKDPLKHNRWMRKLPRDIRYFINLKYILLAISNGVKAASRATARERKGGRPQAHARQKFVQQIVRDYKNCLDRMPSTTKEGTFEELVRFCLDASGRAAGKINPVIRNAVRFVKIEKLPKLPRIFGE